MQISFIYCFVAKLNFLVPTTKPFTLYMHEETYETSFRNQNYFLNLRVEPKAFDVT